MVFTHVAPATRKFIINTQILRARQTSPALVRAIAIAIPLLLIAPAIWNGYPLLQFDTGGYLAQTFRSRETDEFVAQLREAQSEADVRCFD